MATPAGGSSRLTREEELTLALAAQRGDAAALDRLVRAHARLVQALARSVHRGDPPFEDLVQEGMCGLIEAVARFDPTHAAGASLATFARRWILRNLHRASCAEDRRYGTRLPEETYYAAGRLRRAESALTARLERAPTSVELARELKATVAEIRRIQGLRKRRVSSLEAPDGSAPEPADRGAPHPIERLIREQERQRLERALERLPARLRRSLARRYGLDTGPASRRVKGDLHEQALAALRALLLASRGGGVTESSPAAVSLGLRERPSNPKREENEEWTCNGGFVEG